MDDALTSERPYKAAWPPERACAELRAQAAQAGRHFDPGVVTAFLGVPREEAEVAVALA